MPSLKMKTKVSTASLIEKVCLGVCQKSSTISKRSCSHVTLSLQTAEPDSCIQKCQDDHVLSRKDMHTGDDGSDRAIDHQASLNEGDNHFQKQSSNLLDSGTAGRIDSVNCASNMETIFSPSLDPNEVHSVPNLDDDGVGSNNDHDILVKADGADGCRQPFDYQTCSVSDFSISDMIISSLPFDGSMVDDDITKIKPFPDYKYAEPNMLFDMVEECMLLPFLENTAKLNKSNDTYSWEEAVMDPDNSSLYLAINQTRPCNQESDLNAESDQAENFDPQSFIKNLPELSNVVSNFQSSTLPKQSRRRKSVTLVLDLDETLVHSTLEHCDADFTFSVFFNMKEHTVYVKQRPHLHTFLERVADMFEVVIFTASQSIYAEQLLDILDPERRLISQRVYRESCVFSDGTYTKDLTVLGVDLAKVAIIDNCPQVFRLQVDNGIPIKSWFSDPSDCALISLIPFLETLVEADDVRPIIAKRFGNKE
uniref:Uncharacterized protein MANES_15G117300 n=2 Tax=Rhizophora mucronata TaxID=61149 RepID=A0A2P2LZA9_RHIMU